MSAVAEAPVTAGPLLRVEGLRAGVRTPAGMLDIVRGVDLAVDAGEVVGLVGESGSGKSFTAMSVAGLLPKGASVAGGSVRLGGRELVGLTEPELRQVRGAEVAMVYQDPLTSLNPLMRIGPQVTEGLRAHGWARARRRLAPTRCSTRSACRSRSASRAPTRTSSPAACASGCSSRARSPRGRGC